jgi:hypothetical protein
MGSIDASAHQKASGMVGALDCGRRRRQAPVSRRTQAKGNAEIRTPPSSPGCVLPPRGSTSRGASAGPNPSFRGGLNRRLAGEFSDSEPGV